MTQINFTVNTKPYDDFKLYQRKNFSVVPGINSLVGCNGSGKSTLIDLYIIPQLRKQHIEYYKYNDRREGGSYLMDAMLNVYGDMDGLAQMFMSSEGERIVCGLVRVIQALPRFFKENKDKPAFLILDAIDSGMSVDEISEIKDVFLDTIIPDAKERYGVDLYIIIAANNYEWCNDSRIHNINVQNGKVLTINSYDEYKAIIYNSRKVKDKLREPSHHFVESE